MKYDDASWHYGGNFPDDLPDAAGATHTGMFITWALMAGLGGELHTKEMPEGLAALRERAITPGQFFLNFCDGKFTDEDLNEEGNHFTAVYFDFQEGQYLIDYESQLVTNQSSLYYVPDTWCTYDILQPILDKRLAEWRATCR